MTAFESPNNGTVTIVLSNENDYAVSMKLTFRSIYISGGSIFRSSTDEDCEPVGTFTPGSMLKIPRESVMTLSLNAIPTPSACEICETFRRNCPSCRLP